MDINKEALVRLGAYRLQSSDIDHLFKYSGLSGNALSPYRYNEEQAAVTLASQWLQSLAESPVLDIIARLLLEPDLKIFFQSGGSTALKDKYWIFMAEHTELVLAQFTNDRDELLNLLFPDWESYLQWWTSVYCSASCEEYLQVFKDINDLETLVCALHCVDVYRRIYMASMLAFSSPADYSIHTHAFIQLLKDSLNSADTRWLLTSLFELVPGLENHGLSIVPDHLKIIEKLHLVSCDKDLLLTLGECSTSLGNQFIMSWRGAVGWQATVLLDEVEKNLAHGFLVPNAFTNHLFLSKNESNKRLAFRYQAINRFELIKTMHDWMAGTCKTIGLLIPAAANNQP